MRKHIFKMILILLFSWRPALAADDSKQFIGYLQGEVTITADGRVKQASLKNEDIAALNAIIIKQIKSWEFQPVEVNGNPVEAIAPFDLKVIATFGIDQKIQSIMFRKIDIGRSNIEKALLKDSSSALTRASIGYPTEATRYGYGAEVDVAVEIDADGSVRNTGLYGLALVNSGHRTDGRAREFALKTFGNSALVGVHKMHWSQAELAANNCLGGCIGKILVEFAMEDMSSWATYSDQKVDSPAWAQKVSSRISSNVDQSLYVKLKSDPTDSLIMVGI